jgi:putative redox protein
VSLIEIRSIEVGQCRVRHVSSGASFSTDLPTEYGGRGDSFSATDLLAAALGVCIATNLDAIAARHSVPLDALRVLVEKSLASEPKRVAALAVQVNIAATVTPELLTKFTRAASHCTVHRSLHPEVEVTVEFKTYEGGTQAV